MTLNEMIEVLQAAQRGEPIEFSFKDRNEWFENSALMFDFSSYKYRITPKKELSLVEELRNANTNTDLCNRAADLIEELESCEPAVWLKDITTNELLDEIKRRMVS